MSGRIGIVARNSFTFVANGLYDKKYDQALQIFSDFIQRWGSRDQIKRKTVHLFTQLRCIVLRGKASLYSHRAQKDKLFGEKWDENMLYFSTQKWASVLSDINKLKHNPLHKIYIIELFYYKQMIEAKLKFARWYRKNQKNKYNAAEIDDYT